MLSTLYCRISLLRLAGVRPPATPATSSSTRKKNSSGIPLPEQFSHHDLLPSLHHDVTVDVSIKGHGAMQVVVQLVGVFIHSKREVMGMVEIIIINNSFVYRIGSF